METVNISNSLILRDVIVCPYLFLQFVICEQTHKRFKSFHHIFQIVASYRTYQDGWWLERMSKKKGSISSTKCQQISQFIKRNICQIPIDIWLPRLQNLSNSWLILLNKHVLDFLLFHPFTVKFVLLQSKRKYFIFEHSLQLVCSYIWGPFRWIFWGFLYFISIVDD